MFDDVCRECRQQTLEMVATLRLSATGSVTRRWRECPACGWESLPDDVLLRRRAG